MKKKRKQIKLFYRLYKDKMDKNLYKTIDKTKDFEDIWISKRVLLGIYGDMCFCHPTLI